MSTETVPGFMEDVPMEDFNVAGEYVPEPLIPDGIYNGVVTDVRYKGDIGAIAWQIALQGNEGRTKTDGSSVDVGSLFYNNWLPLPGDETKMTPKGKSTKRVAKIRMLKEFAEKMKINMNTPKEILENVNNKTWLGLVVLITVKTKTYQGTISNEISKMEQVAPG